jgi:hypothetical protein
MVLMTNCSRYTDVSLAMRSCRQDGRLLQHSRPATPIDAVMVSAALGSTSSNARGQIWFAASELVPGRVFGTLMVLDAPLPTSLIPQDLHDLTSSSSSPAINEFVAVEANSTSSVHRFSATHPLSVAAVNDWSDFQLWTIAPVDPVNGWALLGEAADKWVAASPARFTGYAADATGLTVTVVGAAGETVRVGFVAPADSRVQWAVCSFGASMSLNIHSDLSCTPVA